MIIIQHNIMYYIKLTLITTYASLVLEALTRRRSQHIQTHADKNILVRMNTYSYCG